ncbi:MAG: hypothetical protein F9K23_10655 [Bacteroidetes bacterium]|nr:MAG: hypothetical protein F9K23_10655 [Bacteroidota bacterium]
MNNLITKKDVVKSIWAFIIGFFGYIFYNGLLDNYQIANDNDSLRQSTDKIKANLSLRNDELNELGENLGLQQDTIFTLSTEIKELRDRIKQKESYISNYEGKLSHIDDSIKSLEIDKVNIQALIDSQKRKNSSVIEENCVKEISLKNTLDSLKMINKNNLPCIKLID